MLEVEGTPAGVVRCLARPAALDRFPVVPGAIRCRVASDELLLLVPSLEPAGVLATAHAHLAEADPDGLALDHTAGWAVLTLSGGDEAEALARLSAIPPGGGFVQGAVAAVPAKAVVLDDRIHLLVAASHAAHVEARIRAACADLLGWPWEPPGWDWTAGDEDETEEPPERDWTAGDEDETEEPPERDWTAGDEDETEEPPASTTAGETAEDEPPTAPKGPA